MVKLLTATLASLALTSPLLPQTDGTNTMKTGAFPTTLTREDLRSVAPDLDEYAQVVAAVRQPGREDQARPCRLGSARREALAWGRLLGARKRA